MKILHNNVVDDDDGVYMNVYIHTNRQREVYVYDDIFCGSSLNLSRLLSAARYTSYINSYKTKVEED